LALLLVAAIAAHATRDYENVVGYTFGEYVTEFDKNYDSAIDRAAHKSTFDRNLAEIIRHNADSSQTWKAGVNQFTDMTPEQMKVFFGYNAQMASVRRETMPKAPVHHFTGELPDSVDWRSKGIVTPVKNQGGCGSCWAFAAIEGIETAVAQGTGKLLTLSPQNLVSCAMNPHHCGGTGGCGGATAEIGFGYTIEKGVSSESVYPYRAVTGTCQELAKAAKIKDFVKLIENNYTDVVYAVANVGPVAVNVDAGPWGSYSSGVFTGCRWNDIDINHVVQVVGYGTDAARGKDYWIVRNSWGPGWGEKGYMRMEKHSDGDHSKWCGPDTRPQDGTGCDGGPSVITACGSCGLWYDVSYATGGSLV